MTISISIIIPVFKGETAHHSLVQFINELNDPKLEVIISDGSGRANSMNIGAKKASNAFLWFMHADTSLETRHIDALKSSLEHAPENIHYFDLEFKDDGPKLVKLNEIGANIRSNIFGIPWGDQAFCMHKDIFQKLGQYDENLPYGEDHVLIWKAHLADIKLKRIKKALVTSARQYQKKGWLKLTLLRQYLWLKQAAPYAWKNSIKKIRFK